MDGTVDHAVLLDDLAPFAGHPDTRHCATQEGAYKNCQVIAVRCAEQLRALGYAAAVERLVGAPPFPDCDPRWDDSTAGARARVHFVAVAGPPGEPPATRVDFTARQFDPSAPFPVVYDGPDGPYGPWTELRTWYDTGDGLYPRRGRRPRLNRFPAGTEPPGRDGPCL